MSKVTDGAGMSINDMYRHKARVALDRKIAHDIEATRFDRKTLQNFALPLVGIFAFFYWFIDIDPPSAAAIGFLFLAALITYVLGFVLAYCMTFMIIGVILGRAAWRRRQDDRILNLREDEREHLVHYAFGGDKMILRKIVLRDEVRDWAKEVGVKMDVLPTYAKQGDIPLVWFRKPEHAVAFKMRWY